MSELKKLVEKLPTYTVAPSPERLAQSAVLLKDVLRIVEEAALAAQPEMSEEQVRDRIKNNLSYMMVHGVVWVPVNEVLQELNALLAPQEAPTMVPETGMNQVSTNMPAEPAPVCKYCGLIDYKTEGER